MDATYRTKSRRSLTEAEVSTLATQAETGFDLSTWRPRELSESIAKMPQPKIDEILSKIVTRKHRTA